MTPTIPLRDAAQVMRLDRLGSAHASRLSFMRLMLRRLKAQAWTFARPTWDIDASGTGVAVYTAQGPDRTYALVAFAHDLPPEMRSDRVIATAWDATFALFDGVPTPADIARLRANVPLQEAGRLGGTELSLSRANRSVRLWEYVVDCLARGQQPEPERLDAVGYLMRTTAVYGSGKFGAADREATAERPEFEAPFQVEMLTVYLIRAFVHDLVDHMARARNPDGAVRLDPALARRLGIGNSTGLGMAPFLINHPVLLHNWIAARETALVRVRSLPQARPATVDGMRRLVARAEENARLWQSSHALQREKLDTLRRDLARLRHKIDQCDGAAPYPWQALFLWAETALGLEGQEQLVSLLLEPHGDLVDDLAPTLSADEGRFARIDGTMPLPALRTAVSRIYRWAFAVDWSDPAAISRVWYTSAEKLEPRLGNRFEEPIAAYEQPLCPGRDAVAMCADLDCSAARTVGEFLIAHPQHRHIARRAQIAAQLPYAELRDNTLAADMLPIDLLRLKLSFFGAGHFDPRSDRWVRITMYRGAPLPDELGSLDAEDWHLPARTLAAE